MAENNEAQVTAPRGADWEVVSLTASTYAASPGGSIPEVKQEETGEVVKKDEVETSNTLFMSGHFEFPPRQPENALPESAKTEILENPTGKDDGSVSVKDLEEENWDLKNLIQHENVPPELEKTEILENPTGKDDGSVSVKNVEEENWDLKKLTELGYTENTSLNLAGKEKSIYDSPTLHSLHSETTIGALNLDDETSVLDESIYSEPTMDPNTPNTPAKEDNNEGSGYADWLKKQAVCFYAHAKETNTLWSVFAAAAVMGIVIIGHKWHQEKWQVIRHEWKTRNHDEKIRMMAGPISRFKYAIIGGNQHDFSIRGGLSREL
ncbi:ATG8-interacting protein 2-like [Bidens hawaiensis]|uniref:ATG8-interacting protein 2-like n=1 Tax=Bidens hawaiensis TaxID=980011 RepID=UPI00404BA08B